MLPYIQSQLDCVRGHLTDILIDRCTIYTPPAASPYAGEEPLILYPDDWTVIAAGIPCRLRTPGGVGGGIERMAAAGVQARHMFALDLSFTESEDLVINKTSRVRLTTNNNRDFEVIGVPDVTGPRVTRVLEVQEVD